MKEQIEQALNKVRPFLQRDNGDVEFIDFIDGVVSVRMTGDCGHCPFRDDTVVDLVETILIDEVPGVVKVVVID